MMLMPRLAPSMIIFTITLCGQSVATKKVFHYEKSQPTTSPTKESHYNEELYIEKPPTPKCPYDTQQQPGETVQDDAIARDEHKQAIEEQHNDIESMKWHLIPSPVKMDADLLSPMRHFSAEEPHQEEPEPGIESKKDLGYELVNHKFRTGFGGGDQEHSNSRNSMDDLDNNWWAWRNSISYFPSGQAHLRKHLKAPPITSDHHRHKSHFSGWLTNKDVSGAVSPTKASRAKEVDGAKQHSQSVTSNRDQKAQRTIEEPISPPLSSSPVHNSAKSENINELDQQDQLHFREPVMMMNIDEQSISVNQQQQETTSLVGKEAGQGQVEEPTASPDAVSALVPSLNEQRVRESLLKAADIARQLTSTTVKPDTVVRTRSGFASTNQAPPVSGTRAADFDSEVTSRSSSTLDSSDNERQFWTPSDQLNGFDYPIPPQNGTQQPATRALNWQFENNSLLDSSHLNPIFLGFGQVQENEPISRSGRTQARFSCQFGDGSSSSNMSISNVEWAKFDGNYNPYEHGPSFDCIPTNVCDLKPVKTDALTTVHPRPAVQNYINTMAPSYSVTLHEVDKRHRGVYRCSATRQVGDRRELVYRIIPFE